MTFNNMAALFGAMAVLAFIPSVSVLAVSTRSATYGFIHGFFTTLGILLGDIIFILLAIFGLTVLAETMGSLFVLVKYLGGVYLIWLGTQLWRSKAKSASADVMTESSLLSSFLCGLFITLGDQKAILFYLGFFPAFLDLSTMSFIDAFIIILIAIFAVGGVKLGYAYMAEKTTQLFKSANAIKKINLVAGTVLIAIGLFLVVRA